MQVHPAQTLELSTSVLSIGVFDGVHRGHQDLIRRARERAVQFEAPMVVYTFDPPPRTYFKSAQVLTPLSEKLRQLDTLGIDHVVVARFDADYATRGTRTFLDEIATLNPLEIWEGSDFRFGGDREGDLDTLRAHFTVRIADPVRCDAGKVISSSRVRTLLLRNEPDKARELLC